MNKTLVALTLLSMGALLGTIVVFEVLVVIQGAKEKQTSIAYHDSKGVQVPTIVAFFQVVDGYSVPFKHLCDCNVEHHGDRNFSAACLRLDISLPGYLFPYVKPHRGRHLLHMLAVEAPPNRNLKEFVRINCTHTDADYAEVPKLWVAIFAMSMQDTNFYLEHEDQNFAFDFYTNHMLNHPFYVTSGGYLNLVLMGRRIVQTLDQKAVDHVNTLIDLQLSRTPAASWNYTEIAVAWGTGLSFFPLSTFLPAHDLDCNNSPQKTLVIFIIQCRTHLHNFYARRYYLTTPPPPPPLLGEKSL